MNILIKPLDIEMLNQSIILRDQLFPNLSKSEYNTLAASLNPEKYTIHEKLGINSLEYWVAKQTEGDVIGLIGLYTEKDDLDETVWLGWFGVNPAARGLGVGTKLLEFALNEALERGFQELKLYTTKSTQYAAARSLYIKRGFIDISPADNSSTRYYSIDLTGRYIVQL